MKRHNSTDHRPGVSEGSSLTQGGEGSCLLPEPCDDRPRGFLPPPPAIPWPRYPPSFGWLPGKGRPLMPQVGQSRPGELASCKSEFRQDSFEFII